MGVLLYANRVTPFSMVLPSISKLILGNNLANIMIGIKLPLATMSILNVSLVFKLWGVSHFSLVCILVLRLVKCTSWQNRDCTWSTRSSISLLFSVTLWNILPSPFFLDLDWLESHLSELALLLHMALKWLSFPQFPCECDLPQYLQVLPELLFEQFPLLLLPWDLSLPHKRWCIAS